MGIIGRVIDRFLHEPPSNLRCRAGDLAIFTGAQALDNRGRMVRVIRPGHRLGWWKVQALQTVYSFPQRIEVPAGSIGNAADCNLRPLRDGPGVDETLRWAGKPEPKTFTQAMRQAIGEVSNP